MAEQRAASTALIPAGSSSIRRHHRDLVELLVVDLDLVAAEVQYDWRVAEPLIAVELSHAVGENHQAGNAAAACRRRFQTDP